MAEESCRKRLRDDENCPICLDYYTDPVTLDCGHNFCSACIASCWSLSPGKTICPQCKGKVETKKLRTNSQMANMAEIVQGVSNLLKHHSASSMEEADQEFAKDQISHCLEILRQDRENIFIYKAENEKESQDLLAQIQAESKWATALFRKLHQFLEEQEAHLLYQMEEAKAEVARKRDENLATLSKELSSLDGHIQELEEKQQQSADELQSLEDTFERFRRETSENPVKFPAALRLRIHDFSDINPYLEAVMKKFKDNLLSGLQIQEAKVTLDEDPYCPNYLLSNDLKSVSWKNESQDLADMQDDSSKESDDYPVLLGCEELETGRSFWDVEVGPEEEWAVGVAEVFAEDFSEISPENGFWDLGKWNGEYRVHDPLHNLPLIVSQEVKKIRVTVNCEGGRVAFYDADTGRQLYVYTDVTFSAVKLLPYFSVSGGGRLTILS